MKKVKQDVLKKIALAEDQWLDTLKLFLEDHYKNTFLPSHDATHHLRTWKAAKEILLEIAEFSAKLSPDFIEAVLLASLFHDTGIIETPGIKHGEKGKSIYLKYIAENCEKEPSLHKKIASVIEKHDQKTENLFVPFYREKTPDLLTVVSIADDMDALGTIGIYRYAEIYLHRNIPLTSMGMVLLENVSTRYNHFSRASSLIPSLLKKTLPKYQEIISFYDNFNQQLLTESDPLEVFSGHIGVVNYIRNFSVIGKVHPLDIPAALENFRVGKFVQDYFLKLKNELEKTSE